MILPATPLTEALLDVLKPFEERPSDYYGLLTNPPGQYGCMRYGSTTAITLRGSDQFATKALNLFDSFGGDAYRTIKGKTYRYATCLNPRRGEDPCTCFFAIPADRVRMALRLYLYGQIYARKREVQIVLDEEGDFVDTVTLNDEAMLMEASRLADSFITYEIGLDYSVSPTDTNVGAAFRDHEFTLLEPDEEDHED